MRTPIASPRQPTGRRWRGIALVLATLVLGAVAVPAGAEPPPTLDGLVRVGVAPPPAGAIGAVQVEGSPRLGTAAPVSVSVPVTMPDAGHVDVVLNAAGQQCVRGARVPAGTTSVVLRCTLTSTAGDIPSLRGTVQVRLTRGTDGLLRVSDGTANAAWPTSEGDPLPADEAQRRWRALTETLSAKAAGLREPTFGAAFAASQVWQAAMAEGWRSDRVHDLLDGLLATRNPRGGYGLSAAWDAYGDGTVNAADTTYTVTTAGHVGGTLLEAYRQGALGIEPVEDAVDALLAVPRLDGGTCLAYSSSPNDAGKPCVYNVSLGAAAFLVRVREVVDYRAPAVDALVAAVRSRLSAGYDRANGYWAYAAGANTPQDMSHQMYTASSVDVLDPSFHAMDRMMATPWWRQPSSLSQPPHVIASSMMLLAATQCRYARIPGVIAGAQRLPDRSAPPFVVVSMANQARTVLRACFGATRSAPSPASMSASVSVSVSASALMPVGVLLG